MGDISDRLSSLPWPYFTDVEAQGRVRSGHIGPRQSGLRDCDLNPSPQMLSAVPIQREVRTSLSGRRRLGLDGITAQYRKDNQCEQWLRGKEWTCTPL